MNFRKNNFRAIIFCSLLCILPSCQWWSTEEKGGAATEAAGGIQTEKPSFVLVNLLDKELFDDCRIKGSINVPFDQIKDYALKNWDKDATEVVLYCTGYTCSTSSAASQVLTDLGFKKILAYEGGAAEAKQLGFEMEGPCGPVKSAYLKEYERPQGMPEAQVKTISAQDLKKKLEEIAAKR